MMYSCKFDLINSIAKVEELALKRSVDIPDNNQKGKCLE